MRGIIIIKYHKHLDCDTGCDCFRWLMSDVSTRRAEVWWTRRTTTGIDVCSLSLSLPRVATVPASVPDADPAASYVFSLFPSTTSPLRPSTSHATLSQHQGNSFRALVQVIYPSVALPIPPAALGPPALMHPKDVFRKPPLPCCFDEGNPQRCLQKTVLVSKPRGSVGCHLTHVCQDGGRQRRRGLLRPGPRPVN